MLFGLHVKITQLLPSKSKKIEFIELQKSCEFSRLLRIFKEIKDNPEKT